MTLSDNTIPLPLAECLADLFSASAVLTSRLHPRIAARLPEAARLCDARVLADLCRQDPEQIHRLLETLDQPTSDREGRQPFGNGPLLVLYRSLSGMGKGTEDHVTRQLSSMDFKQDRNPAPRIARVVAAAELAVGLRRLHPDTPALQGVAALVMRQALRSTGIMIPMVEALVTPDPKTDAEGLLSASLAATDRAVEILDPAVLLPALLDRAAADLPDMRPVLAALERGTPLPRGDVAGLAGLPDRTARRRIAVLLDAGWAASASPKGPLLATVPPAVLAAVLQGEHANSVLAVSK